MKLELLDVTLSKPVILITQEIDKIPFDFTHLRYHDNKDDVTGLEFDILLKSLIQDIYNKHYPKFRIHKTLLFSLPFIQAFFLTIQKYTV